MTILPSDSSEPRELLDAVSPEPRLVTIRPGPVLAVLGIAALVGLGLILVYLAWQVLTWILVAVILACALNPAVEALERRGIARGYAAGIVFLLALLLITGVGFLIVPPLITQVNDFVDTVPDFVDDLTKGRGPLGLAPGRLPDRRSRPRGDRGPGCRWGARTQPARPRPREKRGDRGRRGDHDRLPDVLHAPRRPAHRSVAGSTCSPRDPACAMSGSATTSTRRSAAM